MRRYGRTDAIVLGTLRQIGVTCREMHAVSGAALAAATGLTRRSTSRALARLHKVGALRRTVPRMGGPAYVKLRHVVCGCEGGAAVGQDSVTQRGGTTVPQSDPLHLGGEPSPTTTSSGMAPRLDTVRALLDAVG